MAVQLHPARLKLEVDVREDVLVPGRLARAGGEVLKLKKKDEKKEMDERDENLKVSKNPLFFLFSMPAPPPRLARTFEKPLPLKAAIRLPTAGCHLLLTSRYRRRKQLSSALAAEFLPRLRVAAAATASL